MKMLFQEDEYGYFTLEKAIDKEVNTNLVKAVKFLMKKVIKDVDTLNKFSEGHWMETAELDEEDF